MPANRPSYDSALRFRYRRCSTAAAFGNEYFPSSRPDLQVAFHRGAFRHHGPRLDRCHAGDECRRAARHMTPVLKPRRSQRRGRGSARRRGRRRRADAVLRSRVFRPEQLDRGLIKTGAKRVALGRLRDVARDDLETARRRPNADRRRGRDRRSMRRPARLASTPARPGARSAAVAARSAPREPPR